MTMDAATLLAGPRGRRVCLEYLRTCADRGGYTEATTALWWAAQRLEPGQPTVLRFSAHHGGGAAAAADPVVTPADAASAVESIPLKPSTAENLRQALAASVERAMYWQPPDGDDALAATEELRAALTRVADVIGSSPLAAWWATPVDLDDQWTVPWEGGGQAPPETAAVVLASWRESAEVEEITALRDRPTDPTAPWGGVWWSIPPQRLVSSTRSLGAEGPAGLWFVEDGVGSETAVATPVDAYPGRVIEIDGPDGWIDLCRRHPLVVTASRRHDWYQTTGRAGDWVQPDWSSVATEADAVHLTVTGYLSAAGRALDLGDGRASVIAGWNPDTTYWFAGAVSRSNEAERWRRTDDGWEREAS